MRIDDFSFWKDYEENGYSAAVKRIRSFNAENLGSVGQRAAKLLAIKL